MAKRIPWSSICFVAVGIVVLSHPSLWAQEVASIDLTQIAARTELRRPPVPAGARRAYSGGHEIIGCADSGKSASALLTTLTAVDRKHYSPGDDAVFQYTIENIGSSPVQIPMSPHLTDLQPVDPGEKFSLLELSTVLLIGGKQWQATSSIGHKLYGSEDKPDTVLTLQGGQWVRIIDSAKIGLIGQNTDVDRIRENDPIDHLNAHTSISRDEMLVAPTTSAVVSREVCLSSRQGPNLPVTVSKTAK